MKRLIIAALAVTALVATACDANKKTGTPSTSTSSAATGGQLVILATSAKLDLDPAKSQSLAISAIHLLFRSLTTWQTSPNGAPKMVPDLATDTGQSSADGKTWTYHLKPGLKYSTGETITAQDVKYGIERTFAPELGEGLSYHKGLLVGGESYKGPFDGKDLASIETPDPTTIVFHLNKSYGDWPWVVSTPQFSPVPKAHEDIQHYGDRPSTSGPYEVASVTQGVVKVFKRNPNWVAATDPTRTAKPDTIRYEIGLADDVINQRLIASRGEDKNAISTVNVPPSLLPKVQSDSSVRARLATSPGGLLEYLAINVRRPVFAKLAVRQALEYAINKQAVQVAFGGPLIGGDIASTLITPGIPGYQKYNAYPAPDQGDPGRAKDLLKQAGVSGLHLTLLCENTSQQSGAAQAIQASLKNVGITVTLRPEDPDSWNADTTDSKADYDLALTDWLPDFPSAQGNIEPLFDSSEIGNGSYNSSGYSNKQVDAGIAAAIGELDEAKAAQQWSALDQKIMAEAPVVPLLYARSAFLHGSNVANFYLPPYPPFANVLQVGLVKP
jgi:peptide/nickel transport system substrate-binding protein